MAFYSHMLIVHTSSHMYGSDKCLIKLIQYIKANSDTKVSVVIPGNGKLANVLAQLSIPYYIFDPGILRPPSNLFELFNFFPIQLRSLINLCKLIKLIKPDVVYSNTTRMVMPAIAAHIAKVPHICHIRELNDQSRFAGRIAILLSRLSVYAIAMSNVCKNYFAEYSPSDFPIFVVYDGIDLNELTCPDEKEKNTPGHNDNEITIGMAGWIAERKGQKIFVQLVKELLDRGYNVRGEIAGDVIDLRHRPYYDELIKMINNLSLNDKVLLLGYQEPINQFLHKLDIFIMPSIKPEGAGMVAVEAMGTCLPVIAINIGGVTELIDDNITGFLVSPDITQMADKTELLINNPLLRHQMGSAGRKRCESMFNLTSSGIQLFQLIDRNREHSDKTHHTNQG